MPNRTCAHVEPPIDALKPKFHRPQRPPKQRRHAIWVAAKGQICRSWQDFGFAQGDSYDLEGVVRHSPNGDASNLSLQQWDFPWFPPRDLATTLGQHISC